MHSEHRVTDTKQRPWSLPTSFFVALSALALFLAVLPVVAHAEMSFEERLEMKKRAQKQVEQGEVPAVKPGMSYEERLYIKKKQQLLEKQQNQQPQPPPQAQRPRPQPQPLPPQSRPRPLPPGPDYRPPITHGSPPGRSYNRDGDWLRQRCWDAWGGRGHQFRRCLDGDRAYLYPGRGYSRDTDVYIETSPPVMITPPVVIRKSGPEWPANLLAERYPSWYGPQVTTEAVITAQDAYRNDRSFHLVGILPGNDPNYLASCIARNLTSAKIQINEVASGSRYDGADAEAVVFSGNVILNMQILAEGCAEFDAAVCNDMDLDFCDAFQDAESSARRNRLGIWR